MVDQENAAYPQSPARWFILNVEANVEVDLTAADGLAELQKDLAERGVRLGLARVKQDLLLPLQRAGLMELIGTDMLFPTLPVAEKAYLVWAAENPYVPAPLPIEAPDDDDAPVWNVYRFTEEAHHAHDESGQGVVAKATHAALAKAHQAAVAVTSAITSIGDPSSGETADTDPSGDTDSSADAESTDDSMGATGSDPDSSAAPVAVKGKGKGKAKGKAHRHEPTGADPDGDEDGILADVAAHPS